MRTLHIELDSVPRPRWVDWYTASLEAGRSLDRATEVVYFTGKLKQRLDQHEVHTLGTEHAVLNSGHLPRDLSLENGGASESLAADQLVKSLLNRATLTLHAADRLTSMLRALRALLARVGGR